jgi:hypothetical protein
MMRQIGYWRVFAGKKFFLDVMWPIYQVTVYALGLLTIHCF